MGVNAITQVQELLAFGADSRERVENAILALKAGKGILLVDDENRENEGDLIFPAQTIRPEDMALMIRHCSGIVCLCLTEERADYLNLFPMVRDNTSRFQTPFTVSIEAKTGVTTGISASDRVQTIRAAINLAAVPDDLARPGHIFPLRAKNGGVFVRNGHTEGSIDIVKLAGLGDTAVLCELMNENGTVARLAEITDFAHARDFVVLSIEDLIHYRSFVRDYQ